MAGSPVSEDWRAIAHEWTRKPDPVHPGLRGRVLLHAGTRTSDTKKKLRGKTVTDARRDDIMAILEQARKQRLADAGGLKGLFGGGR